MCLIIEVKHPELVLAKGVHAGFQWVVVNNGRQFRCGYVRVPAGHPWHGEAIEADVHGGITFAEADVPCDKGGADDGWWLGFDTMHCFDAPDETLPSERTDYERYLMIDAFHGGTVRTQEYVEAECRRLCEQAKEAATPPTAATSDGAA